MFRDQTIPLDTALFHKNKCLTGMKPCYWFCSYSTFIATLVVLCVTPFLAVISEIECNSTALASWYHPLWMRREWYRIKLDWWAVFSINSNSVSYPKKRNDTITWNISYFDCWYFSKSILNSASASWINEQLLNYERTDCTREVNGQNISSRLSDSNFSPIVTNIRPAYSWDWI